MGKKFRGNAGAGDGEEREAVAAVSSTSPPPPPPPPPNPLRRCTVAAPSTPTAPPYHPAVAAPTPVRLPKPRRDCTSNLINYLSVKSMPGLDFYKADLFFMLGPLLISLGTFCRTLCGFYFHFLHLFIISIKPRLL
jgi:hypothetical protein